MLLICDQCGKNFITDKELTSHIKDNHKTYKPCDYFVENRCEQSNTNCRYHHIKIKQGEQICFKCGLVFTLKPQLIDHIRELHGNVIFHRFLRDECKQKRCFFSHDM